MIRPSSVIAGLGAMHLTGNISTASKCMAALRAAVLVMAACALLGTSANARNAYRVEDITSRQFADNAVEARNAAMNAVLSDALETVFRRLARSKDLKRLPKADQALANRLLRSLQIRKETGGQTSYAITAHVHFDEQGIRRIFARSRVRAYAKPGPSALLIAAHMRDGEAAIYTEAAEWDAALREVAGSPWLMTLKVADGTPEDRFESIEHLRNNDRVSFDYLRVRYGTHGAVLAELMEPAKPDMPTQLRLVGDTGAGPIDVTIDLPAESEDPMTFAAARVVELLDDHWKQVQRVGNSAGVRINGRPINPVTIEIPENGIEPDADAVLAELRLNEQEKPKAKPRVVRQVAVDDGAPRSTGSLGREREDGGEHSFSAYLPVGMDEGTLRNKLSAMPGMTGFMVSKVNARDRVTIWYRGSAQGLHERLQQAGYTIGRDLVTNEPLLIRAGN